MYNYSSAQRGGYQSQQRKRLTQLAFLLLVIAVVVLSIVLVNATSFRGTYEASTIRLIDFEVDSALSQLNNLSRTGGSSTTSVLGKIRQHVYGAQTLMEQNTELTGRNLLDPGIFTELLNTLDSFEAKKQAGQPTIEQQTVLTNRLQSLSQSLEKLQ